MRRVAQLVALFLALSGAIASAELVGSADQIVSFSAYIKPSILQRKEALPITVHAQGNLKPTSKGALAHVNSLEIEINRHSKLLMAELPACRLPELVATTDRDARRSCGAALVGHGEVEAKQVFPEQAAFGIRASLLMFNGIHQGSRVIFLHVHSTDPPSTIVVPLMVHTAHGTFGTVLSTHRSKFLSEWLYLSRFEFVLGRRFTYRGRTHGYVQATCPAPGRSNVAIVPFARVTFRFPSTKALRTTLVRGCHVKE